MLFFPEQIMGSAKSSPLSTCLGEVGTHNVSVNECLHTTAGIYSNEKCTENTLQFASQNIRRGKRLLIILLYEEHCYNPAVLCMTEIYKRNELVFIGLQDLLRLQSYRIEDAQMLSLKRM
jgi:hypothetical protein